MIIRCHHLREAGLMNECCFHCHLLAGCCLHPLPHGHKAILCCGHADSLTLEERATILSKIPVWEAQETLLSGQTVPELPTYLRPVYQALQRLEGHERYLAAFIFGSVARGVAVEQSNTDVFVIVDENRSRHHPNHPMIGGIQLNLAFLTLEQFEERTRKEIDQPQQIRPVTIAESIIIFDKTKKLHHMREEAQQLQPRAISTRQQQALQSMLFQCQKKAEHFLDKDPSTALLVMHMDLISVLLAQYKQQQKWWVDPQQVLADLSTWDLQLCQLVRDFLATGEVSAKFRIWSAMINYILQLSGEHHPLPSQNCPCNRCQKDIALLLEAETR
jgi:Nucleotidyltransferase domain